MRRRAAWSLLQAALVVAVAVVAWLLWHPPGERRPIVIGVLHSLSGTLAVSEAPLVAAVQMAAAEINAAGGLLGRPVQVLVEDTRSDPARAAVAAERLIGEKQAVALFGCWTSACRKAVKPVIEAHRHLLFYPMAYEGLEQSPHIVYLGASPNQQLLPATGWAMQGFGRRVYLVGSDYVFPRVAHALLRDFVQLQGGQVLGERLLPLGSTGMADVVVDLRRLKPDLVLSTINGDSNAALFGALADAGMGSLPLLSFSADEPAMHAEGGGRLERHFAAWSYLASLPGPGNGDFLARLRRFDGDRAKASDPVVSAYVGVQLWAAAVREVGDPQTEAVNANIGQQSVVAPHGVAIVDAQTRHLWRQLRIAQVRADGRLDEVFASPRYIKPSPWPTYRPKAFWEALPESHAER
ncbi:urea ABC transporter substrate-binding protein [Pelomonas aquatica]|jgi:urea transport system substrate-binding protein|uniref:Urea ABC transporter substrate-binding protein n=1 Tax=Pelomonas aquatica TaxID=431058 RepID=A0A9X4R479_9BURK|nr:urea ABC transporter substrate-binding protein [Pelomonas aquatica]MCY4755939.1 urea ABC transporter substrate-binding protein [Pelomonas aquatica]MDG0862962.1 urea ABC transporter substrate-binding protein [Pelomonas aquatica]